MIGMANNTILSCSKRAILFQNKHSPKKHLAMRRPFRHEEAFASIDRLVEACNDPAVTRLSFLMGLLKDEDQGIRIQAISLLGKMGSEAMAAAPALLALKEFQN